MTFPSDFLWGSATAAHQVEGGNHNNDWWDWEHTPGSPAHESSGDGIDHFTRYDADFALLASLGQNAHRLSVEWSRIEPAQGEFSQAALDHYRRVLESLHRHGLRSFVTMYHFTLPRWFAARGGWLAPDALDLFGRFVERVGLALGDLIDYACTVNEPQILPLAAYVTGQFPPGHQDVVEGMQVNTTLIAAHRVATAALRSGGGRPLIGTCLQLAPMEPLVPSSPDDIAMADALRAVTIDQHLDDLRAGGDVGDWVGLQYYTRARIDASTAALIAPAPEGVEATQMGWEMHPAGFGEMLRLIGQVGLPVVVTENGIATAGDNQRVRYLASHLSELEEACRDGVDVRGYLYWSAFDNFEWAHGYAPTFGLIGIERQNGLRRVPRPSAHLYGEVARTGSLGPLLDAVARANEGTGTR